MAVISTARDAASRSGLYAARSISMPSTVQNAMEQTTAATGGRFSVLITS